MPDRTVEEVLAGELHLAKIEFDAAMGNPNESASEITRAVKAYTSALSRFNTLANYKAFPGILQK
jgi:hypothetical protein